MKSDIEVPLAQHVHIIAIKEWDKDILAQQWNVYLANEGTEALSTVLILFRGNSEDRKTSTLRRNLGDVQPKNVVKIEFINPEVLGFSNEYLVTFFVENKLFEKRFVFEPNSISEEKQSRIPLLDGEGILAKKSETPCYKLK